MSQRRRFTNEDRGRILGEWTASGLSGPKFAEIAGTSVHTLYLWRRRAKAHAAAHPSAGCGRELARGAFAEVVLRPAAGPAFHAPIEIVVADAVVRVGAGFDDHQLRRVLDVVRSAG